MNNKEKNIRMKKIYLYALFLYININVLYASNNTVSCENCLHITQQLEKLTTTLPHYRSQLLQNIGTPSSPSFDRELDQITSSVHHLNQALNRFSLHSPLYLTDSNECFFQSLHPIITYIVALFQNFALSAPADAESSFSFACESIPNLLLKLSPSIDFRIQLARKCHQIYHPESIKDNKTLPAIKLLNNYLNLYQINSNLYQHAANIFQEIIDKNIAKSSQAKQLYSICATCDLFNLQKACVTLHYQYNHIIENLSDTIQYSAHILSPILIERMVQFPLKTKDTEKRIALIPDGSTQAIFIVENEKIYFPTTVNIWNPKIGLEEEHPSLILVETESVVQPDHKIESRIISPEQFQGKPAPKCVYIARDTLHRRIQNYQNEAHSTMKKIHQELSTSSVNLINRIESQIIAPEKNHSISAPQDDGDFPLELQQILQENRDEPHEIIDKSNEITAKIDPGWSTSSWK